MEYRPRYHQPFTLAEAVALDVSIITDEIARLHNSLKKLRDTQAELRKYQSAEASDGVEPDTEVQKALDDNEVVIGSQSERILILKMALSEKGVLDHRHYDTSEAEATRASTSVMPSNGQSQEGSSRSTARQVTEDTAEDVEGGMYL